MKKMKWSKLLVATSMMLFPICVQAQLIKGVIKADSIESVQIAYSPDGNMMNLSYQDIILAADGSFSWDINLPEKSNDNGIYVDNEIFGVHVE